MSVHKIQDQLERRSHFEIIEIVNPLRLHDTPSINRSEEYTELSKGLQRMADKIKALQFHNAHTASKITRNEAIQQQLLIEKEAFDELTMKLLDILSANKTQEHFDFMSDLLKNAIIQFFEAAKKSDNLGFVDMPINYVLKQLGYTGVISSNNDSFNRGLLAMEYISPKKIIISPVKMGAHRKASTEHPKTPLTEHSLNEASDTSKWKSARRSMEKGSDSELSNGFLEENHRKRPR